ncbi:hypothetical protein [Deinococcus yunweiensis]|uniref:hypothetical protein n=1 Tax=Deinococcus yunweiensis TaxID=367282 RepID=UPI00398E82C0
MNRIGFEWIRSRLSDDAHELRIVIDGDDLIERLAAWEARLPGAKSIAGSYAGLPPSELADGTLTSRLLRGDTIPDHPSAKTSVLYCGDCGFIGCWDMLVRVDPLPNSLRWSGFEHPHRSEDSAEYWDYSGFGPFEFDRSEYLTALDAAQVSRPSP